MPQGLLVLLTILFTAAPSFAYQQTALDVSVEPVQKTEPVAQHFDFVASDGFRLRYVVFGHKNKGKPILIAPGKGETFYDYVELARDLMLRGLGPIYLLEHRGQGHSQREQGKNRETVHIESFERYVQDFIEFAKGPLAATGKKSSIDVIAHSMGGAIANLALLKEPDLFQRVAYLAPMFDIDMGLPVLNRNQDALAAKLIKLLCAVDCVLPLKLKTSGGSGDRERRSLPSGQALRDLSYTDSISPQWLREAVKATQTIRNQAQNQQIPSVIIAGRRDRVIELETLRKYSCSARNCALYELDADHAIHHSEERVYQQTLDLLSSFFSGRPAVANSCVELLR